MTHRLTANYAKNYCHWTLIVQVILENVVTCFLLGGGALCTTDDGNELLMMILVGGGFRCSLVFDSRTVQR